MSETLERPAAAAQDLDDVWDEGVLERVGAEAQARLAAEPDDPDALWTFSLAQHNLAVLGRRGSAALAETALARLAIASPNAALIHAYLGNAIIMVARDSRNVMTKAGVVRRGLVSLDRAVELDPDHLVIRLLRAGSGKRLPKLFGRRPIAKADLRRALELLAALPKPRPRQTAETSLDLALLLTDGAEDAERRALLARVGELAPGTDWARKAADTLKSG